MNRLKHAFVILLWIILIGTVAVTCADETVNDRGGEKEMSGKRIEDVLKEHTNKWMSIPGVVGTGQGLCDDKPCIKVFVIEKTHELDQRIPDVLEGHRVIIEQTGAIKALPKDQN